MTSPQIEAVRLWPRFSVSFIASVATVAVLGTMPSVAAGQEARRADADGEQVCSQTARAMFQACGFERQDAYWIEAAKCLNLADRDERSACQRDNDSARRDGAQLCRVQRASRLAACEALGENRYDPDFDADDFEADYANPVTTNRYMPLRIGAKWAYQGGTETVRIEVQNETKLIDGVRCLVVRDSVFKNGDRAANDNHYPPFWTQSGTW